MAAPKKEKKENYTNNKSDPTSTLDNEEKISKINDLEYLDWIFNHGWQRVKKGGFG